jgi:hypothetical protein
MASGSAGSAGSNQAPVASCTTSRRRRSSITTSGGRCSRRSRTRRWMPRRSLDDDLPRGGPLEQVVVGAHHVRHDDGGGTEAVRVPRKRISAKRVEKSVHLALRVVKPAGAGPAVRASVNGLVPVRVDDTAQLARQEFGELVPGHGDELVGAALRARARPVAQPPAPHCRCGDARGMPNRAGQVAPAAVMGRCRRRAVPRKRCRRIRCPPKSRPNE